MDGFACGSRSRKGRHIWPTTGIAVFLAILSKSNPDSSFQMAINTTRSSFHIRGCWFPVQNRSYEHNRAFNDQKKAINETIKSINENGEFVDEPHKCYNRTVLKPRGNGVSINGELLAPIQFSLILLSSSVEISGLWFPNNFFWEVVFLGNQHGDLHVSDDFVI